MLSRQYVAIDLKSFYASVECVERGLDPLDACLVVADASRTNKTICLAVSPALKAYGTGGRPRLFEVEQKVREANRRRGCRGAASSARKLADHPDWAIDYIVAPPRMALYLEYSTRIYQVYLKYVAPEDVHVYSIDEVFIDITPYLKTYKTTAHELALRMIRDVLDTTGITATAGIGTNMYLCKVAMDIVAKKMPADADGVRIASLDEMSYRRELWSHMPLTDFWRVGRGIANRLARYGILTMGDIARVSLTNDEFLYQLFGVNAELLIDHAWGWEPVTMEQVKAYRPATHSISSGQVLSRPYTFDEALTVLLEMTDVTALELVEKGLTTDQITVTIGYDNSNLTDPAIARRYDGPVHNDHFGRPTPAHSHGTANLSAPTSLESRLSRVAEALFRRIANPILLVRRVNICFCNLKGEAVAAPRPRQLDLFSDGEETTARLERERTAAEREHRRQQALLEIRQRYGKNAILRGLNFSEGATQRDRNHQIGGHQA